MRQMIISRLRSLGISLAVAESATGGKIADCITNVDGSSDGFLGAVVAYDVRIKKDLLGVKMRTLERFGTVSQEVAQEMAIGVRSLMQADIGIATTGIAGPTGGNDQKPVGLVYIAVASDRGIFSRRLTFDGNREGNKQAFAEAALLLLKEVLDTW